MYGRMAFILSSLRTMVLHSGRSRWRRMASKPQRVVQMPQPMHLFGSTTLAPQPRQRAVSALTCSSVKHARPSCIVRRSSSLAGALARRVVKAVDIEKNVFLIEFDELPAVAADGEARVRLHKAVQGHGALLAGGDGVNGELWPV